MSDTATHQTPGTRRYAGVEPREFKGTIPPHLLAKLPDDERFLVETVSRLESQNTWVMEVLHDLDKSVQDIDGRINTLEQGTRDLASLRTTQEGLVEKVSNLWEWKQVVTGKWGVVVAISAVVAPVLIKLVFDYVTTKLTP